MQAVISRVHRIVTTHASSDDSSTTRNTDALALAREPSPHYQQQQPSSAAATLSSLGAPPPPTPSSITIPQSSLAPSAPSAAASSLLASAPNAQHSLAMRASTSTPQQQLSPVAAPPSAIPAAVTHAIQLAVEQLQYATLLSERKQSVQALHTLARSYNTQSPHTRRNSSNSASQSSQSQSARAHNALGDASVPIILAALVSDPRDTELMEAMLELLQELIAGSPAVATALIEPPPPLSSSTQTHSSSSSMTFTRTRDATPTGVQICLELLEDPSPWIRGPTIALIKQLQDASSSSPHSPDAFVSSVLACQQGLRRLLDVVSDKREHIRDAALQVLVCLTEREPTVQQFLAFDDGFAHLFRIIEAERGGGGSDSDDSEGGDSSVLSDCLQIVTNMVKDNVVTQMLLRETPFLETHVPLLLRLPAHAHRQSPTNDNSDTTALATTYSPTSYQKRRLLKLGLQLVRFVVADLYEGVAASKLDDAMRRDQQRKAIERQAIQSFVMRQHALMQAIAALAVCTNEELTDVQLQALDLLGLVCHSNSETQMQMLQLHAAPSGVNILAECMRLDCGGDSDDAPQAIAATALLDAMLLQGNETPTIALFQQLHAPLPSPLDEEEGEGDNSNDDPTARRQTESAACVLLDAIVLNAEAIVRTRDHQSLDAVALRSATIGAWKATQRLAALLASRSACKDVALRMPSEYSAADSAAAVAGGRFFTRCLRLLAAPPSTLSLQSSRLHNASVFQLRVAILTLLIQWSVDCQRAVEEVTASVANVSVLIELFNEERSSSHNSNSATQGAEAAAEAVHIRGLVGLLFGCCLEFLVVNADAVRSVDSLTISSSRDSSNHTTTAKDAVMTRDQLLEIVSKRIGLQRFTDALVQFEQAPLVVACMRAGPNHSVRTLLPPPRTSRYSDDTSSSEEDISYLFALYDKAFVVQCRELAPQIQKRVIALYATGSVSTAAGAAGAGAAHAMSAYQDLIRIQDKQIQELEQQLSELRAASSSSQLPSSLSESLAGATPSTAETQARDELLVAEAVDAAKREAAAVYTTQLQELERRFSAERLALTNKIQTLEAAVTDRETRYNGLSAAFEQLEAEVHATQQQRSHASVVMPTQLQALPQSPSAAPVLAAMTERCDALEAALADETRVRIDLERHASLDKNELEMHARALQQTIDALRRSLTERDEQLRESRELLEALDVSQTVLKHENDALQQQLVARQASVDANGLAGDADAAAPNAALEGGRTQLQAVVATQTHELTALQALVAQLEHQVQATAAANDAMRRQEHERLERIVLRLRDGDAGNVAPMKGSSIATDADVEALIQQLEDAATQLLVTKQALTQQQQQLELVVKKSSDEPTPHDAVTSTMTTNTSMSDDAFILLASLEMHCTVLQDALRATQGDAAVATAAATARQRGAVLLL